MQVSHRFVKLSEQDSGKQHLFTWRADDGAFLCHAMYQSGADLLEIPGQEPALRGQTLRILTQEMPPDQENALAPSQDAQSGTLRLQVDGADWQAENYATVARRVLATGMDRNQQCAVLCQLGSLYNLMATRYGKLFDTPIAEFSQKSIEHAVTDGRLRKVSNWFAAQASRLLTGEDAPVDELPETIRDTPVDAAKLSFRHGIEARSKQKVHTFVIGGADATPLLAAEYQSGTLGETIIITYPLANGKSVAVPYNLMEMPAGLIAQAKAYATEHQLDYEQLRDATASVHRPVAAEYQLQKLDYYRQMYGLSDAQQAATLLMLGSVTRLFATRYQREFDPITIEDAASLQTYVKDKGISIVADELVTSATKLLREGRIQYPPLPIAHTHFGTLEALESLKDGQPSLDTSLYPPLDYWALSFAPNAPNADFFSNYPHHIDHSVGHIAAKASRAVS